MNGEIIKIEELGRCHNCTVSAILFTMFHYADILEVEDVDENLKAYINGEWLYIKIKSKNSLVAFTSKEDKDIKLSSKYHLNPVILGNQITLSEFMNSFSKYIESFEKDKEQITIKKLIS